MNNNNIVKIGTALKWRNTFDVAKKYYQENIVTACGSVFRCKVLQAQGKPPVRATDEFGHIVYANEDVWDVLVDMAYYYNFAVDSNKLTNETLEYVKLLDKAYQKQQQEIEAIREDNKEQWKHIHDIERLNAEQQREIDSVLDTISCFSEGIWSDTLLWNNDTLWDNNKYALLDELREDFEANKVEVSDTLDFHQQQIFDLQLHNSRQQEEIDSLTGALSCFSTGIWDNCLLWGDSLLWDNNKFAITDDLQRQITSLSELHNTDTKNTVERFEKDEQLLNEHDIQLYDLLDGLCCFGDGQWNDKLKWSNTATWENSNMMCDTFEGVFEHMKKQDEDISSLNEEHEIIYGSINELDENLAKTDTINGEQQRQIDILLHDHSTISTGGWNNGLLWVNGSEWRNRENTDELSERVAQNTNDISLNKRELKDLKDYTEEAERKINEAQSDIEDINTKLEDISSEQATQNNQISQIGAHFSCFADGVWGDWFLWNNDDDWANGSNNHENRIAELEVSFASMMGVLATQQKLLAEQMDELKRQKILLDTIMACLSVISVGAWNNSLLWYNEARWSNSGYSEDEEDKLGKVTMDSYDEKSGTVVLNPIAYYYDEVKRSLGLGNVEYSYNQPTETLDFK